MIEKLHRGGLAQAVQRLRRRAACWPGGPTKDAGVSFVYAKETPFGVEKLLAPGCWQRWGGQPAGHDGPLVGHWVACWPAREHRPLDLPNFTRARMTGLWRRFGCRVALVVVALDASVAAWARQPIDVGPGAVFVPLVVGPEAVPVEPEALRESPELAVLAALAHRHSGRAVELAVTALDSLSDVAAEAATIYADILIASLPEVARRALEEQMAQRPYEFQSDFAKKYFNAGIQQGREHGARDARRTALLAVLAARCIEIDSATHARIDACEDIDQLETWIVAAAVASSQAEVFASDS